MSKRILLIIGAGIAAYKSLELIRLFKKGGIAVTPVLTQGALEFVTELSVASLAAEHAHTQLFSPTLEAKMGHIALTRNADLVLVAPATADLMAKMAHGLANDLASTLLLASNKNIMLAPAMNVRMWENAATQRNVKTLRQDGIIIIEPTEGEMACGEFGIGRMAEPEQIYELVLKQLQQNSKQQILKGKEFLITAGPTFESLDPVRYIANRSSGRQGYALAEAAQQAGAQVTLISGPVNLPSLPNVRTIHIESAEQMLNAVLENLPKDVFIATAAVADWKAKNTSNQKIKKVDLSTTLELSLNPDILKTVGQLKKNRPKWVVGFAAETQNLLENAKLKLKSKNADMIVANDVSPQNQVMGGDENTIHILDGNNHKSYEKMSKINAAQNIIEYISGKLK